MLVSFDNFAMRSNAKLPKALGKRIQKRRKELKLTQEDLAEKVDISRAYVGYIEQGRNTPSLEVLQKIAKALKKSLNEFF